jgi:hypothetical protein
MLVLAPIRVACEQERLQDVDTVSKASWDGSTLVIVT